MAQFTTAITLRPEETKVSGDWAFDRGQFSMTMTPKMAPDPKSWKVAREMGNSNMPMAMPAANTKKK